MKTLLELVIGVVMLPLFILDELFSVSKKKE